MFQRLFGLTVIVFSMMFVFGCVSGKSSFTQTRPAHDTAIRNEKAKGLNLELLAFSWYYREDLDQIQVSGTVRNLTGKNLQACRFIVQVHDQLNRYLGNAESFLQPTYLRHNQEARFEFALEKGHDVESLHLNYYFKIRY
ncbi:MAG: hypothetical protein JRG97_03240 [Deltaproteobacteria bacterium]|nr:hypothetical protein [Deltaproteobacteria bacterium]MBW2051988.1 hypothetical protein [Deltaproteobacteria bacterium]MBW2140072.1 hypothetical protein [Deltaproteobacteria bacterium]MBW2322533.1 hypothetical protein [Deltaproteobacteria bacterium]